jgi:hypothetical protein
MRKYHGGKLLWYHFNRGVAQTCALAVRWSGEALSKFPRMVSLYTSKEGRDGCSDGVGTGPLLDRTKP